MSVSPPDRNRSDGFTIEPGDRFSEVNRASVDHEIRPGRTISFLGEVELSEVDRVRTLAWNRRKISYTAFVVKAVALALREFPQANRRVYRNRLWPLGGLKVQSFTSRDVAVAVERDVPGREGTVLTDIIRAADETPLDQITTAIQVLSKSDLDLNPQWRESNRVTVRFPTWLAGLIHRRPLTSPKLWAEQMGGAVLVTSPVKEGVDAVLGSWSHPIGVSFGLVKTRAVVVDNAVVARPTFILSLNFDRRVLSGNQAARFFKRIVTILEHPTREFDDFKVSAGYFFGPSKVDGTASREKAPIVDGSIPGPIASQAKKPAPSSLREAPPTRLDFPTIELDQAPEPQKIIEIPDTREDLTPIDDPSVPGPP